MSVFTDPNKPSNVILNENIRNPRSLFAMHIHCPHKQNSFSGWKVYSKETEFRRHFKQSPEETTQIQSRSTVTSLHYH